MDLLQLQKELSSLKETSKNYEDVLRDIGIELKDFEEPINGLLDECAKIQHCTNLHSLEENYLKEFYYIKKREEIDNTAFTKQLETEINQQEDELAKENDLCKVLQEFTESANKRLLSNQHHKQNLDMLEVKIKSLEDRQNSIKLPKDLDVDGLLKNVQLLTNKSKSSNKQ